MKPRIIGLWMAGVPPGAQGHVNPVWSLLCHIYKAIVLPQRDIYPHNTWWRGKANDRRWAVLCYQWIKPLFLSPTLTNEVNYTVRKRSRFLLGLKMQPIVDPAPAQQLTDLYLARKIALWWGCKEKNECYDRKQAFRRATDTDVLETERDSLKRDFPFSTLREPVLFVLFSQPAHASKIPPLP